MANKQTKKTSGAAAAYAGLVLTALLALLLSTSCTKDLTGTLPNFGTGISVDGSIETSHPPLVILTHTTPVFGGLNINDLGSFMVHGATITMTMDSSHSGVQLQELCLQGLSLTDSEKLQLLSALDITVYDSSSVPNVCVYTLPIGELETYAQTGNCPDCGQEGHQYNLNIQVNGKTITSYTTIPRAAGLTSLGIRPVPNNDSLVNVTITFTVPNLYGQYIRYWTKRNSEPFYTSLLGSVYDDNLIVGQTLTFPIQRGEPGYVTQVDQNTFGYFWKGDTVTVKWASIDSRTYDFYNTLENDGGGSPFSSYVRVKSNVVGDSAVGVWAGYGSRYYTITVPR